ncbi:mannitol dehydrogenase [Anaerostipes sp.]|uniref:mannitol dehydrogenase family protein n=1 Tax=Anaerostipes sp. TaxID=1872530 RepID=UPI0025BA904B|nr:mannitol dehydrogenase [Anaerostipes sp.]MBS7009544.1 mannitol dehydrogenase [Anaerostipes sp.]
MKKQEKELLVIGAGNIGRGVIGGLFYESGYHLYLYDIMAERMKQLKEQGTYRIERVGTEEKRRVLVKDFDVLDCTDEKDLVRHMEQVDLIACCVYEGAFESIAGNLAQAVKARSQKNAGNLNILLCVNALGAPDFFERRMGELLEDDQKAMAYLREKTGICQVMVGMAAMPSSKELMEEDPFAVTTKLDGHIGIDAEAFKGQFPKAKQVEKAEKAKAQIYRKVYTGNMKHCMTAFLGKARGCTYIADTYDDPWIEECITGAFYEAEEAVSREYGFTQKERDEWVDFIMNAPKNRNLKDEISRVAAGPKGKLARENRFTGPALLCMKHRILPFYLAKGIAYGFLYREEADPESTEITDFVKEHGIREAAIKYCGLLPEEWEILDLIEAQYKEALKQR